MRKLTIKRTKSFVACLAKAKVYIEDPTAAELTINSIPCRKIGELKNGEEKTFEIDEQPAKLFVIGDKLSKELCNDLYEIPAGVEDITLSGQNRFDPVTGNAFKFDNNNSESAVANRKRGKQLGTILFIVSMIVGFIIGVILYRYLLG